MTNIISARHKQVATADSRGETADWETLDRAQMPRIYNFLRYRLRDEATAEDLTATTFEKAWRHRGSYKPDEAAFTTWLFTIARNAAIDYLRTQKEEVPLLETAVSYTPSPEETITKQQDLAALQQLLTTLPDREQEIIALKYGAELSTRQIAKQMGISAVNVRVTPGTHPSGRVHSAPKPGRLRRPSAENCHIHCNPKPHHPREKPVNNPKKIQVSQNKTLKKLGSLGSLASPLIKRVTLH